MKYQQYPMISEEEKKEWKEYRRHIGRLMGELRYKMKQEGRNQADVFLLEIISTYHKMIGVYLKGEVEAYLRTHDDSDTYARRMRKYIRGMNNWLSFLKLFNPEDPSDVYSSKEAFEMKRLAILKDVESE